MKRALMISAVCATAVFGAGAEAIAAEEGSLQGAWTLVGTDCAQTFVVSGGGVRFVNRDSSLNTGIIVRDNVMIGPNSTCRIGRITQQQDLFKVHLSCATSIMFDDVSVTLKVVDDNHFKRIDPDFPEIGRDYQKCSF